MYTIDINLPWLGDVDTLEDGIYVNILSENYQEDDNPNGLYSGFLSGNIFYTSVWSGTRFMSFCIPKADIDSYMYIEYVTPSVKASPSTKSKPNTEEILKSFAERLKEEMEKTRKEDSKKIPKRKDTPWVTDPFVSPSTDPYNSMSIEDAMEKLKKSPIITLGSSKEAQEFLKGFQNIFQTKG